MTLAFSPQRVREFRQKHDQVFATLVPCSSRFVVDSVRDLRRESVTHDEDGNPTGRRRDVVNDVDPNGALRPARITIKLVEPVEIAELSLEMAKACGFKTIGGARDAWRELHPRMDLAQLVWFMMGDVRDRDLYLGWTGRGGSDYVSNPSRSSDRDAPVLTPEQYAGLGMAAGQREAKRRADAERRLATESLAQRVARLEAAGADVRAEIRPHLRIIGERLPRWHKELHRATSTE